MYVDVYAHVELLYIPCLYPAQNMLAVSKLLP